MISAAASRGLDAVLTGHPTAWATLGTEAREVLDACTEREISALVRHQLTCHRSRCDWPDEVCAELDRVAQRATAAALVRGREIAAVLDTLASHGIRPVLLKGVPLAYGLYDAPGLRAHVDTDLLVRRDQVDLLRQVLLGLGYHEPLLGDGELLFCQFQMVKEGPFGIHHVLDVHWKISTQSVFGDLLTYDELFAAAEPVPSLGRHAQGAGRVHALLLACVHPVMHHRACERLIWLYDIHLLISRLSLPELEHFAALAIEKRVAAVCTHQITATQGRFQTLIPEGVMSTLAGAGGEQSATYLRSGRRWHDELVSNVQGLAGWRNRGRLLREVFLPSPRYMFAIYRTGKAARVLLPALYVHRVMNGALKILRRQK